MEKKSIPEVRHRRKQLRAQRKGFADKMKELFMVQDYSDYSEILILILKMFFFEFISTFEWNIYFFISKALLFIYMVLFKNDDIFKNMICKTFYRKMFNKHEIRD